MSYTLAYTGAEIDALLGKIDAIFVAEYGSTIYSEVTAAIAAGNKVIVANAGKVYVYAGQDDNGGYVFTQSGPNAAKPNATYVTLSTGNVWSTATVDLATLQQFYASLMEDTASGSIASFPDGAEGVPVKELTADIEPIQDLHGQASPYPEGGYVNKYPILVGADSWVDNSQATHTNNNGTLVVTVPAGRVACGVYTISQNIGALINSNLGYPSTVSFSVYATRSCTLNTGFSTPGRKLIPITTTKQRVSYTINSALSGAFVFYVDAADYDTDTIFYISDMQIESGSTASPYAPYSNICPISGYTGAEIYVAGGNIGNVPFEQGAIGGYGVPNQTYADKKTPSNTRIRFVDLIYLPVDTACRVSFDASTYEVIVQPYDSNGYAVYGNAPFNIWQSEAFEFTSTGAFAIAVRKISQADITPSEIDSVNLEIIATEQTYSVSWSDHGTVYKGTAQYKGDGEWEITATSAEVTYNGSEAWNKDSSDGGTRGFYYQQNDLAKGFNYSTLIICDKLKSFVNHVNADYLSAEYGITGFWDAGSLYPTQNWIYAKAAGATTVAEFKSWLSANPITVVYVLASPATPFTVTGPDPETLLGDNNMWANTGDISVKYRANTALYIQKMLGGNVQTLGMSPLSIRRPVSISQEDIDQAGEVSDAFTEALDFEPYDEPEELTEEPEAEEEPAEDAEAEEEPEAPEEVR